MERAATKPVYFTIACRSCCLVFSSTHIANAVAHKTVYSTFSHLLTAEQLANVFPVCLVSASEQESTPSKQHRCRLVIEVQLRGRKTRSKRIATVAVKNGRLANCHDELLFVYVSNNKHCGVFRSYCCIIANRK